jgi:hypothetical protein
MEKEIEVSDHIHHILFIAKFTQAELKSQAKRFFHLFADKFTTTIE